MTVMICFHLIDNQTINQNTRVFIVWLKKMTLQVDKMQDKCPAVKNAETGSLKKIEKNNTDT